MQKSVIWAEDLEGHRQPSLYYLSGEEGEDGPHLICDWNGTPTDFGEMEFDSLDIFSKYDGLEEQTFQDNGTTSEDADDDEFVDYPNPAAEVIKLAQDGGPTYPTHRQNDLDFAECAHLDLLSVPPMSGGLLRRYVRNLLLLKSKFMPQKVEADA